MRSTKTSTILTAPVAIRGRTLTSIVWTLQVLLAVQFAAGGVLKLSGDPVMVDMFTTIGAGQWFRFVVGGLEIAGALGVLIPRLSGVAALGLVGLLLGATTTNVLILDAAPWLPLGLLLLSGVVAWGRWPHTSALVSALKR